MFSTFFPIFLCLTISFYVIEASKGFSLNNLGSFKERNLFENSDSKDSEKIPFTGSDSSSSSNDCCIRQRKLLDIGLDVTGNRHYVDIGHCKHGKRSFGRHLEMPERSVCVPKSLRSEKFFLLHGVSEVEVIEDCERVARPRSCSRSSRFVVLFPDTPYERRVDVGHCRGPCGTGHGISCKSVRNRTLSVDGPNGAFCVNVVEECSCEANCYRAQLRQVFTDRIFNETGNSTREHLKVLDIGVCIGKCDIVQNSFQCVFWDKKDRSKCVMSLKNRKNLECGPTSFETHVVTKRDGTFKTILAVQECGCK